MKQLVHTYIKHARVSLAPCSSALVVFVAVRKLLRASAHPVLRERSVTLDQPER